MSAAGSVLRCPRTGTEYPPDHHYLCPEHQGEELVPGTASAARAAPDEPADVAGQPRPVCWNCRARSPNAHSATCATCHESLVPPVLVVRFPRGAVIVQAAGESAELGRAGEYGHVFARHPNVSRWHATVSVDGQGDAWLTPNPNAPNGTFVNDVEIADRTRIGPGDRIRLATDRPPHPGPTSEPVRQPAREPAPEPQPAASRRSVSTQQYPAST